MCVHDSFVCGLLKDFAIFRARLCSALDSDEKIIADRVHFYAKAVAPIFIDLLQKTVYISESTRYESLQRESLQ